MRKLWSIILCFFLMVPSFSSAEAEGGAKAFLLMPLYGESALEESHSDEPFPVAGLAKLPAILTLCRAFDTSLLHPDKEMEVSKRASKVGGPTAFLEAGETIPAGELIKAAVMISAGDAIWTLMENAFGSEEVFLNNIGVILNECGVSRTLESCLGTGTQFSCTDLLKLGTAALESATFMQYAGTYMDSLHHAKGTETELVNANRMIRNYPGCSGLMTGSSREDGYCGLFAVSRNQMQYLCCVIGSSTSEARFSEATRLFDYAYANFRSEMPAQKDVPLLEDYPVLYGDRKAVNLAPHENIVLLRNKSDGAITPQYDLPEALLAPLDPMTAVGTVSFYTENGEQAAFCELFPMETVRSNGYPDILKRIMADYFT